MNFSNPSSDANNGVLIARVRNTLDGLRSHGNLTDVRANQAIFFHIDFVFSLSGQTVFPYPVQTWRLKVFAAVRAQFAQYYSDKSQLSAAQFDYLPPTLENAGIFEKVNAFASAFGDQANAVLTPNLNVISFLARNAVLIAAIGGVGYVLIAYRKPILAALKLG